MYREYCNSNESFYYEWQESPLWVLEKNSQILDKVMTNPYYYRKVRRFMLVVGSLVCENQFAIEQLRHSAIFYYKMIKLLQEDEFAFFKEQNTWLGKELTMEEIKESERSIRQRKIHKICMIFKEYIDKPMNVDENRDIKNEYRLDLKYLIEETLNFDKKSEKIDMSPLEKTSTNITVQQFNCYMDILNLSYRMEEEREDRKKFLTIKKCN